VPRVVERLNRWQAEAATFPAVLRLHYEALRADPVSELGRLALFAGSGADAVQIARAVAFAGLESLREKERSGFFAGGRLGRVDPADPASAKVRAGQIGGYRQLLPAAEAAALDRLVAERLDPALGYR
jgi:hypothetical protein